MKRPVFILFLLAIILIPQGLFAKDLEFEAAGTVASHYMWRGLRLSENGVFQPSVTIGGKGFSANIWANYQFDPRRWSEADFTGAYAGEKRKINYEFGFVHYYINEGLDSDEVYCGIGHSNFLNPSFKAYIDVNAGKGAYLQAGIAPSIPIKKKITFNFKAVAGYVLKDSYMGVNDGGREFSNFYNADFQASLSLLLGKSFNLEPMIGYSTALSRNARQAIKSASVAPQGETLYGGATLTFKLGGSQKEK